MTTLLGRVIQVASHVMHVLSGIAIASIVLITCFDVIMRRTTIPFDFPFEVVCALAGVLVALALPETSLTKTHVVVEYLETKLTPGRFRVAFVIARCLGTAIFLIIGWNAVGLGNHLYKVKQHSAVLEIPEFFLPYFLAAGCFVTSLVVFCQILAGPKERRE